MAWQGIEGHDEVVEQFRRALARGRLASAFLFVGPRGIGKRTFAQRLAQALLCQHSPPEALAPCGVCDSCVQVAAGTHPDLTAIEKPAGKSSIPLELLLGDKEHRMREGLCHAISLKPFMGGRKLAIIDDADDLNEEGANCLLKTLEEPPPHSVLILVGTSAERQLPTIRSRTQLVRFRPLATDLVSRLLVERELISDPQMARRLAEFSEGSLARAVELADNDLWTFREQLLLALAQPELASVTIGQNTVAFVDAAGKEASQRRARARQVVGFAADFFRQRMRAILGMEPVGDAALVRAVTQARGGSVESVSVCLQRTLEALGQIERNAHMTTLVECWLDDLGRIVHTGQPVAAYDE
jgi:DNA polymerase-3 subunit delta'